ncbi:MAG: phenylalanine--tRNA ligase subunit beta [Candidatus Izemoplasmatales bacterium]|jgi:phenylalanyl-tRNA synthetase beta chain|nr:phenylalanine--tRNA ligase subunit beta [Candidatus Izemoplasmatales bacterium]
MKISLNWLNQYFSEEINKDKLVDSFNLMSQEVSGLNKLIEVDNLVIGYVKKIHKHEDADKLNVCLVDVLDEELQIICGAPNVDEGQKVIVAKVGATLPGNFKIKKAKIRGVESYGMICSLAELGIQEFDNKELGIYVLGDDAPIGGDPLEYLKLNDYTLELDLTANRADLLSIRGVVYDTACMLNLKLNFETPNIKRKNVISPVSIFTKTKASEVYYGQILENVNIKQSPYWLKSRLIASGIRPINNVVDITNYTMLEYGQPLHAFDYDKIESDKIIVREAFLGETIITLDGEKRDLIAGDIVITDSKKPIALAGVMGGLETEIDENSKTVLLESAVFDPVKVRKTANRLNLKSESSTRFEKGINPEMTLEALNFACDLLIKYADAIAVGNPSFYNDCTKEEKVITLSLEKLNLVTGYNYTEDIVKDILDRLDFKYKQKGNDFLVTIPSRRPMDSYQDLIEEIVRIHGYDKIPLSLPITPTQGGLNSKQKTKRQIKDFLTARGFNETKTYSLVSKELAVSFDQKEINTIKILNPLTQEKEYLRHSIIPSLINVLDYNKSRKVNDIFIYEIANTYFEETEKEKLAILMQGKIDYSSWQRQVQEVDFYHLKGLIEGLFETLKIDIYNFELSKENLKNLHPGISAVVTVNNEEIGFIGKLHPELEHSIGVKDIYVCEIELKNIYAITKEMQISYKEVTKYPSIERDIAIMVENSISANSIIDCIRKAAKKTLNNINIFDVYIDNSMKDKKSIAIRLEFMSESRTLETKEVDDQIDKIINSLKTELKAELRS